MIPGFHLPEHRGIPAGLRERVQHTLGDRSFNAYNTATGAFVQDAISIGTNLKLDIGLRYNYIGSPTESNDKLVTFDPATSSLLQINGAGGFTQVHKNGSDFQPRLGVI